VSTYARAETLVGAAVAPLGWARAVALVVGFSLLVALSAQVVLPLPFTPVPVTGQTFAVLLAGALLGSRLGPAAVALYLFEGAAGLPFFKGGASGAHYLFLSPTAGYLLAFPAAAFVTGWLAERHRRGPRLPRRRGPVPRRRRVEDRAGRGGAPRRVGAPRARAQVTTRSGRRDLTADEVGERSKRARGRLSPAGSLVSGRCAGRAVVESGA
jgi:hypothetical protein